MRVFATERLPGPAWDELTDVEIGTTRRAARRRRGPDRRPATADRRLPCSISSRRFASSRTTASAMTRSTSTACRSRGVAVTNTPGVLDAATADLAFALLLATRRRLVEGDDHVRSGAWGTGWSEAPFLGREAERLDAGHRRARTHRQRDGASRARLRHAHPLSPAQAARRLRARVPRARRPAARGGRRLDPRAADAGDGRPHLTRATRAPAGWRDARQHVARRARRRGRARRGARLGAHQRGPRRVRARACACPRRSSTCRTSC